jgi:AmmeMemoRadiSam system protein B
MNVRRPAVAGLFYPAEAPALREMIAALLKEATSSDAVPKGIIAPHAGYKYSGPVAATAYAHLAPVRRTIRRVVLLGPSHHVAFEGLAASSADAWETPLGRVPVDREAVEIALALPGVETLDSAHAREHSLEVQVPFLQASLDDFSLVPLAVGDASLEETALVLETLWGESETLVVISSDLSHFHDFSTARSLDSETARLIESGKADQLSCEQACGFRGISGLLSVAHNRRLRVARVDLRNSGDVAGGRDRVVGYGSWLVI